MPCCSWIWTALSTSTTALAIPPGMQLLVAVAGLLRSQLQETDWVARLGGDEFVILLDRLARPGYAVAFSQRIIELLSSPVYLEKYRVSVSTSASIGIVQSTLGYVHADDVLRDADIAMYVAKAAGKGVYAIFDPSMRERISAACGDGSGPAAGHPKGGAAGDLSADPGAVHRAADRF